MLINCLQPYILACKIQNNKIQDSKPVVDADNKILIGQKSVAFSSNPIISSQNQATITYNNKAFIAQNVFTNSCAIQNNAKSKFQEAKRILELGRLYGYKDLEYGNETIKFNEDTELETIKATLVDSSHQNTRQILYFYNLNALYLDEYNPDGSMNTYYLNSSTGELKEFRQNYKEQPFQPSMQGKDGSITSRCLITTEQQYVFLNGRVSTYKQNIQQENLQCTTNNGGLAQSKETAKLALALDESGKLIKFVQNEFTNTSNSWSKESNFEN